MFSNEYNRHSLYCITNSTTDTHCTVQQTVQQTLTVLYNKQYNRHSLYCTTNSTTDTPHYVVFSTPGLE